MSGAFELHGEPRKRMGNVTGYGKRRRYMERPPGRMGSQNHAKNPEYGNWCGMWTLRILMNFWWELRLCLEGR